MLSEAIFLFLALLSEALFLALLSEALFLALLSEAVFLFLALLSEAIFRMGRVGSGGGVGGGRGVIHAAVGILVASFAGTTFTPV